MIRVVRPLLIAAMLSGALVSVSSADIGEIGAIIRLPGNCINVFWETILVLVSGDEYFTLGNAVPVLSFLFYLVFFFFITMILDLGFSSRKRDTDHRSLSTDH